MAKQVPERYRRETPTDELGENIRIVGDALHMMSEELAKTREELVEIKHEIEKLHWSYNNIVQRLDYMNRPLHRKLTGWFRNEVSR